MGPDLQKQEMAHHSSPDVKIIIKRYFQSSVYHYRGVMTEHTKLNKPRLTVKEAAQELMIPEATVRDWIFRKKISVVRIGKKIIQIPRSEIERLMTVIPAEKQ
jgi:excisionase family DNA binding protein